MRVALDGVPEQPFVMPPSVSTARIDPETGLLAPSDAPGAILEVFKTEDIARLNERPAEEENRESRQREAYDIF